MSEQETIKINCTNKQDGAICAVVNDKTNSTIMNLENKLRQILELHKTQYTYNIYFYTQSDNRASLSRSTQISDLLASDSSLNL